MDSCVRLDLSDPVIRTWKTSLSPKSSSWKRTQKQIFHMHHTVILEYFNVKE